MLSFSWRLTPFFLVIFGFVLTQVNWLDSVETDVLRAIPYLFAAILLGFAAMFNRSRFIAPIVIVVFAYVFIRERLQSPLSQESVMAMFAGLNILFCSQLLITSLLPEKGMFNRLGFTFMLILFTGSAALWYLGDSVLWVEWLKNIDRQQVVISESRYWVTEALVGVHLMTLVVLSVVAGIRRNVADYALLITWCAGVLIFFDFGVPEISSICFSALLIALFIVYQQSNYQVTYMDALTGIPGRRALEDYLSTLGRSYTIAMLDVDHFKKFNDTYGHDVGDQVLKMVASKVGQVQGGGKAFRYGGEEFTIVFNRKRADDAFVFLEAVRESIQNYQMTLRSDERAEDKKEGKKKRGKPVVESSQKVSVTISIGVANSESGFGPADVIKAADQLLYKAKEAGRNCTIKLDG